MRKDGGRGSPEKSPESSRMLWLVFLLGCGRAALVPKEDLPGENLRRILKEVIVGDLHDDCPLYAAIPAEETWGFLGESLNSIYLWEQEQNSSSVVARMVKNSLGQACAAFFISVNRSQLLDLNQDPGLQEDLFPSKWKKFLLIRDESPRHIWHLPGLNRSINTYTFQLWSQSLTLSTVCLYCRQGNTTHEKLKAWNLNRPLPRIEALKLPMSFRDQFYGKRVVVPMRNLPPYGYLVDSANGTQTYEGLDGRVLRELARKFNFVPEFLRIETVSEVPRNDMVAARTADFVISGSTIGTRKDLTLTSYMAVPGYDLPVDSLQDIEDREIVCYNVVGVPIFDNLYDNNPKVKARLRYYSNDGRDPYWTLTPYRAMVKEPGKYCTATGRSVSSSAFNRFLMNAQGRIPFHVSKQNANMMLKVMILQRHCPYEEAFNDAIPSS
ncbi:unnamed protein product [Darwinula stevensoni]|uniref:Uncharacterized protein n=1 Tax=Darwinula stevensoni TaxID=69355 RepID=A0A7R9FPP0_9CRUS|nr:unnamed protein product [Darwinula stevensoni]CAG0897884.1 unnamed protein product [Darwinula stevensoni]